MGGGMSGFGTASQALSPNVKIHVLLQTCIDIVPAQAHRKSMTTKVIANNDIIEITKMMTMYTNRHKHVTTNMLSWSFTEFDLSLKRYTMMLSYCARLVINTVAGLGFGLL